MFWGCGVCIMMMVWCDRCVVCLVILFSRRCVSLCLLCELIMMVLVCYCLVLCLSVRLMLLLVELSISMLVLVVVLLVLNRCCNLISDVLVVWWVFLCNLLML